MNNIYYQRQSGGLCRMHSLNAYFGYEKISPGDFIKYQKEFDLYQKKFNTDISCKDFDIVASNQKNVVSFILKKHGVYSRYYHINNMFKKNVNDMLSVLVGDFIFIYNENHIWGLRRWQNKWYNVDSMRGVSPVNISNLLGRKNIGFIVPVNIKTEFYTNLRLIKNILGIRPAIQNIKTYLIQETKGGNILGDLEIPLGICMDIWEFRLDAIGDESSDRFCVIKKIVSRYNYFLSLFTNGRYRDIDLILEYVPDIIHCLTSLSC